MKKGHPASPDAAELRRRAEERLKEKTRDVEVGRPSPGQAERLIHELQVHQIELELQNEELERARAELEAALERYTGLYDFAPVGYVTLATDGSIRQANLTTARLLGLERARLVGGRLGLFVTDESRPIFGAFLERVFDGQAKESCDVAVRTDQKETRWLHVEAAAHEGGMECRAALWEITERHRLEQILRFRLALLDYAASHTVEELLQKTLDEIGALTGSPACFYQLVEADQKTPSRQVWSTRTLEEYGRDEGHGRHYPIDQAGAWADCVRERRPVIRNDYASLPRRQGLAAGRGVAARELLVPILRSDRIVAVAGVGNKPIDYVDADVMLVTHLADLAWEIVERKRAEEALQESERRSLEAAGALSEASRQKDQFLAMLSHELRNPLGPIRNSLHILDRVAPGGETAKQAQAVIGRQVDQLTRLIGDLLDVTRVSRGKVRLQREPLDLRDLVLHAAEDHRPLFVKHGVELEVALLDDAVPVHADPTRLAQVIGNLLDNAVKFTPRGGRTVIELRRDEQSGHAVVTVRDTGAGIGADALLRIFEAFVQADTTLDRSRGGLGIGLALVKGLVEMHGGSVSAHSHGPGTGAEFSVRLPLRAATRPERRRGRTTPHKGPRRILLVEDNVDMADSLRVALELDGHHVAVAHEGLEGIRKAREFKPDVALCDIGLPEMDGYAVARVFRGDQALRSTYLVALTGHALPEDEVRAKEAGFDQHLSKPPDLERLERVLADLGRSGSR